MNSPAMSARAVRLCSWLGPGAVVLFVIGMVPLAGFIPPPSPSDSAEEIAAMFRQDMQPIRLGCILMIIGLTMFAPWGAAIAVLFRQTEHRMPLFSYIQLACVAVSTTLVLLIPTLWAVAAYRPDDTIADVTRMLNDSAWFLFLFAWPPFTFWFIAIAVAVFRDRSLRPLFPRWSAYLSLWVGLLAVAAGTMAFFKSGPFAYDGIIAMYIPLTAFLIWMLAFTVAMRGAATRIEAESYSAESSAGSSLAAEASSGRG